LRIPVCGLKEKDKDGGASENGMECKTFYEAVERPSTALRELRAESVASDVRHVVLFRKWRDSAGWILAVEGLAEEHKICKSSTN
jgi:hypothetical protein